jgi:hypothetical protein
MNDAVEPALAYGRRGWRVLPVHWITSSGTCSCGGRPGCKPGKHPRISGWNALASSAGADIWEWWQNWPAANTGVATGRESGIWVLDIDPDHGGNVTLAALLAAHGPLPATRAHRTGSGGTHYVWTCPGGFDVPRTAGNVLGQGIDTLGEDSFMVAPPSVSGKGPYTVTDDRDPVPAPGWLLQPLREHAARKATQTAAAAVAGEPVDQAAIPARLAGLLAEVKVGDRSQHVWKIIAEARRSGYTQGQVVTLVMLSPASVKYTGRVETQVAACWGKLEAEDAGTRFTSPGGIGDPVSADAAPLDPLSRLAAFVEQLRTWLDLPDPAHVLLTLAAAVTRDADGEPVWLLLVAVPSSGKTETVRLLDKRADGRLNEVTAAGLLGWSKGKESKPSGVLARVGDGNGLVTFGDLSSLLATSDGGGRDAAFGLLRRAYDGHVSRDISPPSKPAPGSAEQLSWDGRLTVVAAVTGAIDRYAVHADQLGPRWIYTRIAEPDAAAKRRATDRARKGGLDDHRGAAAKTADALIGDAVRRVADDVPDSVFDVIREAALVTCWGRAAVPRHGYGRREIDGMAVTEAPPRVVRQLHTIARGLIALGLPDGYTAALIRGVALDSMPEDRRQVLAALAQGEVLSTAGLAREAGLHRHVARMRAEELEVIGVVSGTRDGPDTDDEHDRRPVNWRLYGDDGQVISDVFAEHEASVGWHEIMLTHSTTPQDQEEEHERSHNFVPPRAAGATAP